MNLAIFLGFCEVRLPAAAPMACRGMAMAPAAPDLRAQAGFAG